MRHRILVTGGSGFFRYHLISRLLERGEEVLCVDNLNTGDKSNIDHFVGHLRFEFMRYDMLGISLTPRPENEHHLIIRGAGQIV